jgi:hypothetical protein
VVFVGVVTRISTPLFGRSSADPVSVSVDVVEAHKGAVRANVVVTTAISGASCGYPFVTGHRYLIFAREDDGRLRTGLCDGNLDLADAANPFGQGASPLPALPTTRWSTPVLLLTGGGAVALLAIGLLAWRSRRRGRVATGDAASGQDSA